MNKKGNSIIKSVTFIAFFTLFARALGLLRDMITASKFGANKELDAYVAASNVPMIIFMTIGTAITTTLIPLYNEKLKEGKESANKFANNVLNFFILATGLISLICIAFNKPIVHILNPGFKGSQEALTQLLTVILVPTLIFNAVIYIFNGVLQSEGEFTVPSLVSLPLNAITIMYLFIFGANQGVIGLTIVTFIATFAQIIPQLFAIRKVGFKYKLFVDFKDEALRRMELMIIPVIIGVSGQQINSMVERAVATNYSSGSLTALTYSYRVFTLFVDVFVVAISTVIYPMMSKQAVEDNLNNLKATLKKYVNILLVLITPITVIIMLEANSIIYILFERGKFNRVATLTTGSLLLTYALGLLAYGLRDFICKAYYSFQDTKTPMINSAIGMLINVALIFVCVKFMGLTGLGLANSISTYICCFLLIYQLKYKIGKFSIKSGIITSIKTIVACIVMGLYISILNSYLLTSLNSTVIVLLKLIVICGTGLFVFVLVSYILKIGEIGTIASILRSKIKKSDKSGVN